MVAGGGEADGWVPPGGEREGRGKAGLGRTQERGGGEEMGRELGGPRRLKERR